EDEAQHLAIGIALEVEFESHWIIPAKAPVLDGKRAAGARSKRQRREESSGKSPERANQSLAEPEPFMGRHERLSINTPPWAGVRDESLYPSAGHPARLACGSGAADAWRMNERARAIAGSILFLFVAPGLVAGV